MTPRWGCEAARGQRLGWMSGQHVLGRPTRGWKEAGGSGELYFDIAIITTQLQN